MRSKLLELKIIIAKKHLIFKLITKNFNIRIYLTLSINCEWAGRTSLFER